MFYIFQEVLQNIIKDIFNRSHRKKQRRNFPKKEYHQRSKVETVNSVMKRIFREVIRAKKLIMQKQEMLLKCLAYNICRLVKLKRM